MNARGLCKWREGGSSLVPVIVEARALSAANARLPIQTEATSSLSGPWCGGKLSSGEQSDRPRKRGFTTVSGFRSDNH